MSPELLYLLRRRIRTSGALRFDEFMKLVLYSDPHGYYRNHVPGADSDYQTSPTLTPWFGRLVVREFESVWERLGSPAEFSIVEVGAGNADLAASATEAAEGAFAQALRWVLVEPIDTIARLQKVRLGSAGRFVWVDSLAELPAVTGIVLAHEVLDNFPFRIFEIKEHGPVEIRVGSVRNHLQEVTFPIGEEVEGLIAPALEHLEEGDRFELRTGVAEWVTQAAGVLEEGRLMVIDYGAIEPEIWTRHPAGTVATYRRGQLGTNPLEEVGDADITAHVNFSALGRAAQDAGLHLLPLQTQRGWLEFLGLKELTAEMRRLEQKARDERRHGHYIGLMAQRSKVEMLGARGGLGDYLVFAAEKPPPAG
ncbi:MAG TPA: SAM-dependent methyltransferase [Actinomycetota bacterium]|nr:SAM-dependent methyltransferase [Actinomycetota bacterium]